MDRSIALRRSTLPKAGFLAAGLLTVAALVYPAPVPAGEKKAKTKTKAHLAFRPTYEQALLEARIRNLPLFVSRHKDF